MHSSNSSDFSAIKVLRYTVIRWNASIRKVGVVYVNVHVSRHLKEELARAINKWLQVISYVYNVI